jgi:hypothetical protein
MSMNKHTVCCLLSAQCQQLTGLAAGGGVPGPAGLASAGLGPASGPLGGSGPLAAGPAGPASGFFASPGLGPAASGPLGPASGPLGGSGPFAGPSSGPLGPASGFLGSSGFLGPASGPFAGPAAGSSGASCLGPASSATLGMSVGLAVALPAGASPTGGQVDRCTGVVRCTGNQVYMCAAVQVNKHSDTADSQLHVGHHQGSLHRPAASPIRYMALFACT